jgi:hypothetical protein
MDGGKLDTGTVGSGGDGSGDTVLMSISEMSLTTHTGDLEIEIGSKARPRLWHPDDGSFEMYAVFNL